MEMESIDVMGEDEELGESAATVPERLLVTGGGVKTRSRRELNGVEEFDRAERSGCPRLRFILFVE
jgi:hypothetical protein